MFDSKEVQEDISFAQKTRNAKLKPSPCIGFWSDICGFGSLLEKNDWDLQKLNSNHVMELQRNFYDIVGRINCLQERTLILNDGIAKTLSIKQINPDDADILIFYLRDLLISHYVFWEKAHEFGISVRAVLSTGEYIPYATNNQTGQVLLQYDPKNVSDYGKKSIKYNIFI